MNPEQMIRELYPEGADRVLSSIDGLLRKYGQELPPSNPGKSRLDHRDTIMITYGDSFFDDQGSTLDCLSRFCTEQLGDAISAVHLLPCFPYTSDDGFSVQDYYKINPDMGDWADVQRLGESYELMFDAVVNHISKSSDWFQAFLAGDSVYQDFFLVSDPNEDYSSVTRPRALPLLHPFDRQGETVHVWTTFSEDQVDLNFRSPDVFVQVLDVLLFYVSRGARYIRLDAIAFIWKTLGTACIHLPQAHQIIQLYRHFIEQIAPQLAIISETNVPHEENISYFGDGHNEAHLVYNFTLPPLVMHSLHQQDVSQLTAWAQSLKMPSDRVCFFNFTASHDGVGVRPLQGIVSDREIHELADHARENGGFVSMKDNGDGTQSPYEINCNYFDFATNPSEPDELRVQRFLLTQSVMLAMPGVPGVYYHSLVGSQNDRQAAIDSGINRRINRAKLDYAELARELEVPESIRNAVFSRYKNMLMVRSQHECFDPYGEAAYRFEGAVFIIERADGFLALHNFSDQTVSIHTAAGARDLLTDTTISEGHIELKPFQYRWLKHEA